MPEAFLDDFAQRDEMGTGWHLGDALGTTATVAQAGTLLRISEDRKCGAARQMVVHALGRFKKLPDVPAVLVGLIEDPQVSLHAMQALRRALGAQGVLPFLERVEQEYQGRRLGQQAAREAKKVRALHLVQCEAEKSGE